MGSMATPATALKCEERKHLIDAYAFAIEDYNRAAQALQISSAVTSEQEYEALQNIAEKTRERAVRTRAAFHRHIAEHGC